MRHEQGCTDCVGRVRERPGRLRADRWNGLAPAVGPVQGSRVAEFAGVLSAHRVIPYSLVGAASMFVPGVEISVPLVALWLRASRPALKAPWLLCATMFLALAMYASALWLNPPPTPARFGCIGTAGPVEHWGPVVVRNVGAALLLAGSLLVRRDGEGSRSDGASGQFERARPVPYNRPL